MQEPDPLGTASSSLAESGRPGPPVAGQAWNLRSLPVPRHQQVVLAPAPPDEFATLT